MFCCAPAYCKSGYQCQSNVIDSLESLSDKTNKLSIEWDVINTAHSFVQQNSVSSIITRPHSMQ